MVDIKLSILIPSVPSRRKTFLNKILDQIETQINGRVDIEVLVFYDNKKRTVGEKRTNLLNLAKGKYTVFIDDDDRVSEDYVTSIMKVIDNTDTDCIVFDAVCFFNGREIHSKYGIEYTENKNTSGKGIHYAKPPHTCVYASKISKTINFPEISFGEDTLWINQVCELVKHQVRIDKVLYYYDYNPHTSETVKRK